MNPAAVAREYYVSTGACAGCPFGDRCHPARKRVHDGLGESRRTSCPFHQDWTAQSAAPRPSWWRSFFRWLVAGG